MGAASESGCPVTVEMWWAVPAVAVGGFLGGLGRWALGRWPGGRPGTWGANMVACMVLGVALGGPGLVPLAAGTGFAGALSTWSTLARELGELARVKRWRTFWTYLGATVIFGIAFAWRGMAFAGRIWGA